VLIGLVAVVFHQVATDAQPAGKVPQVALVFTTSPVAVMAGPEPIHTNVRAFVQGLRKLGYVEGQNIAVERRSAEGRFERFPDIMAELVRQKVDVIVTVGNPMTLAAKRATSTIPIVMALSLDPVEAGLVASLARPGGNVTGQSIRVDAKIYGKSLQLLKESAPKTARVAVFYHSPGTDWPSSAERRELEAAAQVLRLTLMPTAVDRVEQFEAAFASLTPARPDAILVLSPPFFYPHRHRFTEFAAKGRLPSIGPWREFAEVGGLMAYGVNTADMFRRAATYVDKILRGAKPGDLPIEQPMKFELVIDLKTAKSLGLTIPQLVLIQADETIQ
jgi:putative ABC transport system substrate-binding protein